MTTAMGKPTGTVCCILCRGIVTYRNRDNKRFVKHMENEHGAYFDLEFVLATCLMDEEEKKAVSSVIISKHFEETIKVVDVDLVDVKKEPDEDELLLIEEPTTRRGLKRTHEEETTNYNLDVVIKDEPSDKISKLSKSKIVNDDKSMKQSAILPVTSFKGDKNKSICSQCDASFEKEEYLKIHVKIMHSTDASKVRFYCTECDTSFSRKDNLTLHKKKKHADSPEPNVSRQVERPQLPTVNEKPTERTVPKALEKHWTKKVEETPTPETSSPAKNESLEKELDSCIPCNVTFTQRGNLTRHNKKFHPEEVNSLQCNNCEKAFTRQDNLTKHIKNYHPEAVDDKCDQCDYSNPRKDRLKKHKEAAHANHENKLQTKVESIEAIEVVHVQTDDEIEYVKPQNKAVSKPARDVTPESKATTKPAEKITEFVKPEIKVTPKPSKPSEEVKPQNKATSRSSSKPKYITNYPCDKCDKVFPERETILEHVRDIHGIIVPGFNKKSEEEKKKSEVTKFWQNKAKELNDDPEPTLKEVEPENSEDVSTEFITDPIGVENPITVVENLDTVVEDPLEGEVNQTMTKVEQDEGPIARVVITTLEGGDASNYFIRENLNESNFDPLSNNSENVDDPEPMDEEEIDEEQEHQATTLDEATEESADDPESSDELEVQHEVDEDERFIEQMEVEEMETNDEEPSKTEEESTSYLQIDISKSKYFKMNSYTICSLDLYTSGVEGDFEECFDLPEGWKFKSFGPDSNPKKLTHFITPDHKVIKSRLGAIEYLRLSGKYSRQELWEYSKYLNVPDRRFDQLF